MKIATFGARFFGGQISRIEEGFIELGHEIEFECPELIFSNDPEFYEQAYELKQKNSNAKLIFNVLDLPPHYMDYNKYDLSRYAHINNPNRDFNIDKLTDWLKKADIITCICAEVQWQINNWCGLDSLVIFNPIKEVSFLNLSDNDKIKNKKGVPYKYLYVGRACDMNKRFDLVRETINKLGDGPDSLAIIGSENPRWGDYYGVLEDDALNYFYNSVDYLMFPSAFKSIGLPALESIVCQTVPIVTNDDPVTKEFWKEIGVDVNKISESISSQEWNDKAKLFVKNNSNFFKKRFSKSSIANNILDVYNKLS